VVRCLQSKKVTSLLQQSQNSSQVSCGRWTDIGACSQFSAPYVGTAGICSSGRVAKAEWKDINLDTAEWRYFVTKTKTLHIVPLSRQAVEILRELQPLTGKGRYVFPGARTSQRPMSDNAILAAMRRMGITKEEMSGHGFRAVARTILDEVLGFRPDLIEHQLAHAVRDPNGRAYNRTSYLSERRTMMQAWADYLDKLKAGTEVTPIHRIA
jgi:integrase